MSAEGEQGLLGLAGVKGSASLAVLQSGDMLYLEQEYSPHGFWCPQCPLCFGHRCPISLWMGVPLSPGRYDSCPSQVLPMS